MIDWQTLTITASGIGIGWLFSQFSSWWNNRGQRQRTKRRMLFYLLELEYLIARMDVEENVDYLIKGLRTRSGGAFSEQDEHKAREQIRPLIAQTLVPQSVSDIMELERGYLEAVEELSYIAPFIAYRLKGRTRLFKRFEQIRDLIEKVPTVDPTTSPKQLNMLSGFIETLKPEMVREDLKTARKELVSLSWLVGVTAFLKAKRRIRRSSTLNAEDRKDMDDYLDKLIAHLSRTAQQGS